MDKNDHLIDLSDETIRIYNHLKSFGQVHIKQELGSQTIIRLFNQTYLFDISTYYADETLSRSNWTHLTANAFFRTCQLLNFQCDFEVEKRHDGAIRGRDGHVYLCAEWEYETSSIFKEKGEIYKLYQTCKKYSNCDALLFTYKTGGDFELFLKLVFDEWNYLLQKDEAFILYLTTAIFDKNHEDNKNYFAGLRTISFGKNDIEIWEEPL